MMSLKNLIFLILLISSFAAARKTKRKNHYKHSRPPAHLFLPPNTASVPEPPPYHFEEIRLEESKKVSQESYPPRDNYGQQTILSGTYLVDNGLRSIAKGSADQANSAVASQNAAGKQAAYVAKNSLAQAATQAAGTAVAVLKGKEVLLQRLDEQNADALKSLQSELQQLQQAKRAAKAGQYAAQQSLNHVSILTAALNNAQSSSELAQKAASEAAAELASQIDMVAQAKTKLEQVESQLYTARLDYEETKIAAEKATQSAQEAQLNANDAALHANVELHSDSHSAPPVPAHSHLPEQMVHDDPEFHSIVRRRFKSNENVKSSSKSS